MIQKRASTHPSPEMTCFLRRTLIVVEPTKVIAWHTIFQDRGGGGGGVFPCRYSLCLSRPVQLHLVYGNREISIGGRRATRSFDWTYNVTFAHHQKANTAHTRFFVISCFKLDWLYSLVFHSTCRTIFIVYFIQIPLLFPGQVDTAADRKDSDLLETKLNPLARRLGYRVILSLANYKYAGSAALIRYTPLPHIPF